MIQIEIAIEIGFAVETESHEGSRGGLPYGAVGPASVCLS